MSAKEERRLSIESYITKHISVTMKELQQQFKISMNTLRSDIDALEQSGLIVKEYGGVRYIKGVESFNARLSHGTTTKNQISQKAAELIKNGDTVYIDYGTTTMDIPNFIPQTTQVTIITPNMHVIQNCINKENIALIVLPGEYNSIVHGVLSENTVRDLENYHIGKAFMSCCGLLKNGGVCVARFTQKKIKECVMNISEEKYLLAESSKFGVTGALCYSTITSFDSIISDTLINEEQTKLCLEMGVKVI